MDGFALRAGAGLAAGTEMPVVGESLAGRPFGRELPAGQVIRIMTGAVVPSGADTVVPVELTSGFGGESVTFREPVQAGQNVRLAGSDLAAGARVLAAGMRLRAAEIGALAVLGRTEVEVVRRPVVAIVATGDEVVPVEHAPEPHQVRESNSWALAAQVVECGGEPQRLGFAPEEPEALRAMLRRGLETADVLVTIGGISKGTHDLVHGTLEQLGVATDFHGIHLKPGKPTYFGTLDGARGGLAARFVFGLPGNPASSFTVFDLLVRPLLLRLCGADAGHLQATARPAGAPWRPNARLQAVPARLHGAADGTLIAELATPSPSGDPFGMVGVCGYALVPPQQAHGEQPTIPIAGGSAGLQLP
jgi:molybdopterin molybdotransferase